MKFYVNSAINEYEIIINNGQKDSLKLNRKTYDYDLQELGFGRYSLILNNRSYKFIFNKDNNIHHLQVDNNHFLLEVEDEHKRKIDKLFKSVHKVQKEQIIKAPIPGLVVEINIKRVKLLKKALLC